MHFTRKGRRSKIIVDKRFQWQDTLVGLTYILGIGLFVAIPFVYLLRATDGLLAGQSEDLISSFNKIQTVTAVAGGIFALLLAGVWIQFSLRRSHKIAGPIINIIKTIDEFARGNFSAFLILRKKDELQAVAVALNSMAERLRAREQTLNEHLRNRIQMAKEEVFKSSTLENTHGILERLEGEIAGVLDQKRDTGLESGNIQPADREIEANSENAADELLLR